MPLCLRRVTLREPHASLSQARRRDQRLALEAVSNSLQLTGSGPGSVEIAARDLDLDLGVEQRCPLQLGVRRALLRRDARGMLQRVAYGGGRRDEVSSRERHQSETWLRLPPRAMRGQESLFGPVEIALAQPDPPELAERPSHLTAQVRPQFV